ncbi:Transcriptional regulatory protein ZraR [Maioricimonas rarisocia]|uniref:Transcriptional regulatory protein ZraR n=1 Tax=Maioricimonas rarisocia TaxID=2528026 RepID=A0A517Z338_9PLAN|nr:response regulator [Maioricimonas rarisocia]QDU36881.1 Transcriptional regulatory protein ZraR [Maioricimonas rarisocia]
MRRILLVDSDLTSCNAISRTLSALGYGVDVAYDGDGARILSRQGDYAIGLIGQNLTDTDGVKLFTELRDRQARMLGVLMSKPANLYTVASAIGAGMSKVLTKPVDFNEVLPLLEGESAASAAVHSNGHGNSRPRYDEELIAELPAQAIEEEMADRDLIAVIRSVDYPFAGKDRLEYFDRDTLVRVVHLIRRWCRNRLQRVVW